MDNQPENNDWKKEAPLLAGLPVRHPFSIPEGYFDDLSLHISNGVYLEKLKNKITETGLSVPENYFNQLNQHISSELLTVRLKSLAPVSDYEIPEGFFEQQRTNILNKTAGKGKKAYRSKIIRLWHSSLLKYASAACFIILSTTGIYFYQQHSDDRNIAYADMATEQILYDIDEQIIIDHIQANELQQPNSAATDVALENYILNNYSQSDLATDL